MTFFSRGRVSKNTTITKFYLSTMEIGSQYAVYHCAYSYSENISHKNNHLFFRFETDHSYEKDLESVLILMVKFLTLFLCSGFSTWCTNPNAGSYHDLFSHSSPVHTIPPFSPSKLTIHAFCIIKIYKCKLA